jgi:hypothetical protein
MLHIPKWLKDNIQIYRLQEEKAGGMGLVESPKRNKLCSMCSPL